MTGTGSLPLTFFCGLLIGSPLRSSAASGDSASAPRDIGSRLELFVDDELIDRMTGLALVLHRPVDQGVVFTYDAPWEREQSGYVGVFQDGDRFRMYYRGHRPGLPEVACLAESDDGIHWTRPGIGQFEFGSYLIDAFGAQDAETLRFANENNIVHLGQGAHCFVVFKDTNPNAPAEERYKAVGRGEDPGRPGKPVLIALVSPDGIRWQRVQPGPIITAGSFDSQNTAFWDAVLGKYVAYVRDGRPEFPRVRAIRRALSDDFRTWTDPEFLDYGGAPWDQLYTNAIVPYPHAPHFYIGLPMRFVPESKGEGYPSGRGTSDGVFMSSRDGLHWDRRFMEAFIRPGLDPDNWGDPHGNNTPAWGLLETAPHEISVYWSVHYGQDTGSIPELRRGTIRKDGFVSVNAPYAGGEFVTRPLVFTGSRLVLNYSTSAVGTVRVEIRNADGSAIPGYTLAECAQIYGDHIERVVEWSSGSDVGRLAGTPVRLRFVMNDADLYSLRFRDSVP